MRTTLVIRHAETTWHEVSLFWNDAISQQFRASVVANMDSVLRCLDRACEKLELESGDVAAKLIQYEHL